MTDIASAFPKRPIKISKTGTWPGIFSYAGGLMLLAVAGFIAFWQAPGILNDWMISTNPVIVPDAIISDAECNVRRAVFVDCEAHVSYEVKNKPFERDIELLFVDFGGGDYEVDVVRSGNNPGMVALTLGLDMLWNRIIVGSLFVVLLAAGGVALFAGGLRSDRQRRLARRGTILTPVAVQIRSIEKVVGAKAIQFEYGVGKKQQPLLAISRFRKSDEPYWLDPEAGTALAVLPEGATVPVLVDGQLSRLDLSASERYVLLNGRSASPA